MGGCLGVLLASQAVAWARSSGLGDLPRITELRLDGTVLAFAAVLSVVTAVAFAMIATRRTGGDFINGAVRATGHGSRRTTSLLSAIQATQIGMTFVLLLGAWLLGETFVKLLRVEPGYDPRNVLVVPVHPPSPTYDGEHEAVELYSRLMDAVRALPGVASVALTNHGPGGLAGATTPAAAGRLPGEGEDELSAYYRTVSTGYFATMRTRVVAGREFTEADMNGGDGPLIVNETLASRFGGAEAAIGQSIGVRKAASSRVDFGEPLLGSIVGVVADLDPSETGGGTVPLVYVPFTQSPWAQVRLLVRTIGDPPGLIQELEDAVRSVEPAIPLSGPFVSIQRLDDVRASQRSQERLNAGLVGAFAILALVLACIGMYGVTSFIVTLRTREMGVRIALGAAPLRVASRVVRHAAMVGLIGLAGGAVIAAALTSLITSLLFEVSPLAIGRYVFVAALLLAVVAIAAYVPARRASALDPALILRSK
jgi:predicted permease